MPNPSTAFPLKVEKTDYRILLIDLENCPNQIRQLMNNLEQYAQIVVCYAQSGTKIPLDWIIPLTTVVNQNRLKIVKMPNGGKNAADFGIAFWAGLLMAQTNNDAHFDIVSDDADLDHVVSLLNDQQRSAKRIRTQKQNDAAPIAKNPPTSAQEYCIHLDTHQKNRPVKKETLLNHIKSKFNGAGIDAEKLFEELSRQGAIKLVDNKISYNQKKIIELAKQPA
ncbi:PIN domain-containing protein [Methylomicrobium lacus]|uniref:PIN domain-containing protein n=1 Tax=Methylomicrobium lacus TaxID=136992 RepID=UPI00045E6A62|nr:PIN domain-containing protein [Methylomicrobium lacus]